MNTSELSLKELVRTAAEAERQEIQDTEEHPSLEKLLAYCGEELPGDKDRVQRHLTLCAECTRTVLDLVAFTDAELTDGSVQTSADDEAADWQAIRDRLARETPAGGQSPTVRAFRPVRRAVVTRAFSVHALAAALLLVTLGLSFWNYSLHQQLRELSRFRANVYAGDLIPVASTATRDDSPASLLKVPEDMEHLLLFLNGADPRRFPETQVEIVDAGGVVLWSRSGLRRAPEGNFTIELPRSSLPPGTYRILLYGRDGPQSKPSLVPLRGNLLATYRVRIEYASSD